MMSKNSKLSSCEKYSHMIHENVETGEITFDKGVPQEAIDGYKYWAKHTNSTYEEWVKECRKKCYGKYADDEILDDGIDE